MGSTDNLRGYTDPEAKVVNLRQRIAELEAENMCLVAAARVLRNYAVNQDERIEKLEGYLWSSLPTLANPQLTCPDGLVEAIKSVLDGK